MDRAGSAPSTPSDASIRLNRALTSAGVCSRRQADEHIRSGAVQVNGVTVTELGTRIDLHNDTVALFGKPVSLAPHSATEHAYLLLYKPVHVVTTRQDPQGRTTVFDLLPEPFRKRRLVHVGRLDYMSEGLLLLTTDGDITHRLTHARYHLRKTYEVWIRGHVVEEQLEVLRGGMRLAEGELLAPVDVRILDRRGDVVRLEMVLEQGVNRQIRRMCRDMGWTVLTLKRVALGPLVIGAMTPGQCRALTLSEISALRTLVGLSSQ